MMPLNKRTEYQLKNRKKRDQDGSRVRAFRLTAANLAKLEKYRREGQTLVDIVNKAIEAF